MKPLNRRQFVQRSTGWGALAASPAAWVSSPAAAAVLAPSLVPQFVNTLPNPLDPSWRAVPAAGTSTYTLTVQEFQANFGLGAGVAPAVAWGYAGLNAAGLPQAATSPGPTFEVFRGQPTTVVYRNGLVDAGGKPLPNRMPVDNTLDWALKNLSGSLGGTAPVPVVAHLHGSPSATTSDGNPDAWFTPNDIDRGRLFARPYLFENTQEAAHLWYHDHTLGITRTNAYMGLAGFYFIRDDNERLLQTSNVLPAHPYEVPLILQDRMFDTNGQLYYPATANNPKLPVPTHLPEFFGNVMMVNGKAWPRLAVEPRKYRLRLLNASDSRVYELRLVPPAGTAVPALWVIGNELGLLDRPVVPTVKGQSGVLAIAPGERYDVVVDFAGLPAGTRVTLGNTGATPYPAGVAVKKGVDDRLMAFDVVTPLNGTVPQASVTAGTSLLPATNLRPQAGALPAVTVPANATRRRLFLYEGTDAFGRLQTMLGPVDPVRNEQGTLVQGTLTYQDPITELPKFNATEVWEFYNTTVDAHPVHMHLVDFRVLDRQPFTGTLKAKLNRDNSNGAILDPVSLAFTSAAMKPPAYESGRKDTVIAYPGEVTRVLVTFRRRGEYVYHCHILSHEDHEMMRPYKVV